MTPFEDEQQRAVNLLKSLSVPEQQSAQITDLGGRESAAVPVGRVLGERRGRGRHAAVGGRVPVPMAARKGTRGALAESYEIPRAAFKARRGQLGLAFMVLLLSVVVVRYIRFVYAHPAWRPLIGLWIMMTVMAAIQWIVSWRDKPWRTRTHAHERYLDELRVVVNVPVYNEAPQILDRALYALVNQTRPADRIDVIDDGSTEDYSGLRAHWEGWHGRTEITWREQVNSGKRVAQARTFTSDEAADVFVTVDSDSALEYRAIENGLKPFIDRKITSVAGIVLTDNFRKNFFTQNVNVRTLFFQIVACATQSTIGSVLVNRGPLAFYRADLLRDVVPAYINETFFGRHVQLGDDAALTLFASQRGRAVQQSNAFVFSAYPETLSHHLRQWTRWMRGSTIRNCWRIRYLSPRSFGWWFTWFTNFAFWPSLSIPIVIALTWSQSKQIVPWLVIMTLVWGYVAGVRCLAIKRSDETFWDRMMIVLEYPTATLWALIVLQWVRIYGMATCFKQGWNTAVAFPGVEVAVNSYPVHISFSRVSSRQGTCISPGMTYGPDPDDVMSPEHTVNVPPCGDVTPATLMPAAPGIPGTVGLMRKGQGHRSVYLL